MKGQRVFCIGLDGATFDLVDPWVNDGCLPNIKQIMSDGTRAPLRSVILPFSAQAWGSFMTGVNPGKHGIFGFKQKVVGGYSFQLVNNRSLKAKTLWKVLSEMGKRVISVNIPMTYPPEEVNGIIIGGMDSPGLGSDFIFPPDMKRELLSVAKEYVIHLHVGAGYLDTDPKRRKAIKGLLKMIEGREQAVLHLMENYDWDFFAVNFSATDQVQHHFWRYMGHGNEFQHAIRTIYERVDEAIGKIAAKLDKETLLFVMSDHGAGPASDLVFFVDEWLKKNGFLRFRSISPIRDLRRAITGFLLDSLSKKLSSRAKDSLMRRLPGLRARSQGFVRRSLIDWSATKVYSGEHPATLRVNLKGRDREGIVPSEEYEALRDDLIERLETLEDTATGEKVIEKVYKREDLYVGEHLESAPDLVIWPKDFAHQVKGGPFPRNRSYNGIVARKDPRDFFVNGVHRLNGIFVAKGKNIRKNASLPPRSIMDLYPTMLYCLGLGISKSVDGRVIADMFNDGLIDRDPIKYLDYDVRRDARIGPAETYDTTEESKEIEQTLKGLGYID